MHLCACVYLWLRPLPPFLDPLLHLVEQLQQEVLTLHLAFTGGVKFLWRKQLVKESAGVNCHYVGSLSVSDS